MRVSLDRAAGTIEDCCCPYVDLLVTVLAILLRICVALLSDCEHSFESHRLIRSRGTWKEVIKARNRII